MSYALPKPPTLLDRAVSVMFAIPPSFGVPFEYGSAELLEELEAQLTERELLRDWDRRLALWLEWVEP
jgi:hypothetical protein